MELPTPYSAWHATLSNHSAARDRARGLAARTALRTGCRLWPIVLLMLILVSSAQAAFTLIGLSIDDSATRNIVEGRTLARDLPPVRFPGTVGTADWLLDRPALAATLARHLYPPLERYQVTPQENGIYEVSDLEALRGSFRLVARGQMRRVYLCQGEFRSLAHILKLSGGMVFTLEFRELQEGGKAHLEVVPQFYLRLDNIMAHGLLKMLSPLLNGIIDRRVGNLTTATQVIGERMSRDPAGLYREMHSWPDVKPEELEAYRQAFLPEEGTR
jgi:hypothetical protein